MSDTAYSIAEVRAREGARPPEERLFEDRYAALFAAGGAHAKEGTDRFLALSFFADCVRLRTRAIDDFVRDGLDAGLTQLVILGAGFDARGLRMPEIAAHHAAVYEVDFAAQLETKRALLAAAGVTMPAHVKHVACDFDAPDFDHALTERLHESGFREAAGAIFVWEGVIAYICATAIERSLRFMARVGGAGSRLIFDFAPVAFDPDPAEDRVRRAGFTRFEQQGYDALWRRYLSGEPPEAASVPHVGMAFVGESARSPEK